MAGTEARLVGEVVVTAPAVEPVSLADLKLHLRVDNTAEDVLITALGKAARHYCETYQQRAYINTVYDFVFDGFPPGGEPVRLPRSPLVSITSVTYIDENGDSATWSSSDYRVDIKSEPPRVEPAYGGAYPVARDVIGAVTVRATVGYGDEAANVPEDIIAAIKLLAGHLYENREAVLADGMTELPLGVRAILDSRTVEWIV